jgi:hypothetical protein
LVIPDSTQYDSIKFTFVSSSVDSSETLLQKRSLHDETAAHILADSVYGLQNAIDSEVCLVHKQYNTLEHGLFMGLLGHAIWWKFNRGLEVLTASIIAFLPDYMAQQPRDSRLLTQCRVNLISHSISPNCFRVKMFLHLQAFLIQNMNILGAIIKFPLSLKNQLSYLK